MYDSSAVHLAALHLRALKAKVGSHNFSSIAMKRTNYTDSPIWWTPWKLEWENVYGTNLYDSGLTAISIKSTDKCRKSRKWFTFDNTPRAFATDSFGWYFKDSMRVILAGYQPMGKLSEKTCITMSMLQLVQEEPPPVSPRVSIWLQRTPDQVLVYSLNLSTERISLSSYSTSLTKSTRSSGSSSIGGSSGGRSCWNGK